MGSRIFLGVGFMHLPNGLKRLIERYKAKYNISGEDTEILKRVIPELEDEDIIRIYNDLCEEENYLIETQKGYRPNFEKYREEILSYLDDNVVKSEIIKREQNQSSKPLLEQRNYTYISEFTITLNDQADKIRIVKSFYRKVKQLEEERNKLRDKDKTKNIQLSIHIMTCIKHIVEQMKIDLVLYRGPDYKKQYKLKQQEEIELKKIKRRKEYKENATRRVRENILNQIAKQIQELRAEEEALEQEEFAR